MEKKKIIASAAVVAAIVLGATFTAVGGKFKQEEKVNLILSNVTSSSAKEAGLKFKELVEEYSDGTVTVDVFQDNQLGDDKTSVEGVQVGISTSQCHRPARYLQCIRIITCLTRHICS